MTHTTKEIFEKYQVRKTKKQKRLFAKYATATANSYGYSARIDNVSMKCRNIIIGDPGKAKVVYTAHYDTAPVLPFPNFITPKCIWIYLAYQLLITAAVLAIPLHIPTIASLFSSHPLTGLISWTVSLTLMCITLALMMKGPANKHTANDNTSGVTVIFDIMQRIPEDKKQDVAFILFDLEEMGLVGSSAYFSRNKRAMKKKLVVNFDCVSDGDNLLFAVKRKARPYAQMLAEAFKAECKYSVDVATKGVFYPSDQKSFPVGVGVAALKKSKKGLLYMDRIHTSKDTVYDEENIEFLTVGSIRLVELLTDGCITTESYKPSCAFEPESLEPITEAAPTEAKAFEPIAEPAPTESKAFEPITEPAPAEAKAFEPIAEAAPNEAKAFEPITEAAPNEAKAFEPIAEVAAEKADTVEEINI